MWLAVSPTEPTVMLTQSRKKSAASPCTSLGHVALHMSVCLSGLVCSTIVLICGSKPMSSILSASSSTKNVQRRKFVLPASNISINLPGVAIHISTPETRNSRGNINQRLPSLSPVNRKNSHRRWGHIITRN